MGDHRDDFLGASLLQLFGGQDKGAAGVRHIVDDHARLALHLSDEDHLGHLVGTNALLGEDRQRHVTDRCGEVLGSLGSPGIGRHHDDVLLRNLLFDKVILEEVLQERHGIEVVQRIIHEALNLRCVQVDRNDAVRSGNLNHIRDELARDGGSGTILLILARVAVDRQHRGDALSAATARRVNHDEQFHERRVGVRIARRLDHEDVRAAHGLVQQHLDLAVLELVHGGR
mmetsp:Transcript_7545/g.19326  ORF Transcript_7545/g.19326 Transcript_7545/m.19326 type:complete len:229 (+) Transcript_7545:440-1126(+)